MLGSTIWNPGYGLVFLWLFATVGQAVAQPAEVLTASAPIPASFLRPFEQWYESQVGEIQTVVPEQVEMEKAYFQSQAYYTRQLLLSGRVLFNDEASQYLENIADQLLRGQPTLRQELSFHAVLSPSVNAFSSEHGFILVNLGLMARVESEAELAFILAHEIGHYVMQHAHRLFWEVYEATRTDVDPIGLDVLSQLLVENPYSQQVELEADRWGARLYLSSGYDLDEIRRSFQHLSQADYPASSRQFDLNELFPTSFPQLWEKDVDNVDSPWVQPSLFPGTHPDPHNRWEQVKPILQSIPNAGRQAFLQPRAAFEHLIDCCRYSLVQLYLAERQYEEALLMAGELKSRFPELEDELNRWIAYAWYGLARHSNGGRFYDVVPIAGEGPRIAQELAVFTENLSSQELTELSLQWLWQLREDGGLLLEAVSDDLRNEWQTLYQHEEATAWRAGIPSNWLQEHDRDNRVDSLPFTTGIGKSSTRPRRVDRKWLLENHSLGLNKAMLVSPGYLIRDDRKFIPIDYSKSVAHQRELWETLETFGGNLGLPVEILSNEGWEADDLDKIHDWWLLQEWILHYQRPEEIALVSPYHDQFAELSQRQHTQTFVWLDVYVFVQDRAAKPFVLAAGFLLPVMLPYSFYYVLTPRYTTVVYLQAYDLLTYQPLIRQPRILEMRDREDVLRSTLYDVLQQLR